VEVAKLRGQSPAGKARWRPAGSHVSDRPTCWSCTSTAASTAGGAVAASLGLRHPSAAPGSAWAGGLCGGEAWASGEGRRAEVCAPKKISRPHKIWRRRPWVEANRTTGKQPAVWPWATSPRHRLTRRRGCRRLAPSGCFVQNLPLTDGSQHRVVRALRVIVSYLRPMIMVQGGAPQLILPTHIQMPMWPTLYRSMGGKSS